MYIKDISIANYLRTYIACFHVHNRFLKFYRNKKIGTTQRRSMLGCDTHMTLFKDEVDAQSEAVLQYSGQPSMKLRMIRLYTVCAYDVAHT